MKVLQIPTEPWKDDETTPLWSAVKVGMKVYHPKRGIVTPIDFLDVAEETGMIVPIGEWAIRQALAETAQWEGDFRIAINLSPTQVRSPHLAAVSTCSTVKRYVLPKSM